MSKPEKNTYGDIVRASSIMGGAQALNYLVGMVRVKIIAVLLGPAGVGLIGLYSSALGLVGTVTGLGIASSGVREVALAHGQDDPQAVARTVTVLRRACWATGLLGWALSAAAAVPLSRWAFGDTAHAAAIAVLGVTLLLGAISGGQTALLQGVTSGGGPSPSQYLPSPQTAGPAPSSQSESDMKQFVSVVLADTEDTWRDIFRWPSPATSRH